MLAVPRSGSLAASHFSPSSPSKLELIYIPGFQRWCPRNPGVLVVSVISEVPQFNPYYPLHLIAAFQDVVPPVRFENTAILPPVCIKDLVV
jgi:hypothetical protein